MAGKPIRVDNLLLDLENPRISPAESQREALQKIIEDQDIKIAILAEDIIENGMNPMDRLLVIASEQLGKFIVLEGNRRVATLKVLSNPTVLQDLGLRPALRKRLEQAAAAFDAASIKNLDCFVLPDRASATGWITQRHTGENGGAGIVDWSGVASARFRGRDPALQALEFVLRHGELTDDEKKRINQRFPITTLDRLLSTPDVRAKIGFEIKDDKLLSELPPEEAIKPLRRIVRDLAEGTVNVTALKRKKQQVEYVDRIASEDKPDLSKRSGIAKALEAVDEKQFSSPTITAKKAKPKAKQPIVRKTLIPRECALNVSQPKIAEIVQELRSLPLIDFPHAISVLFRVFLEQSVDHYLTANSIPLDTSTPGGVKPKKLKAKVEDALKAMEVAGIPKKDLDGVRKGIDDRNSPLNIDTLHNYVHNRFYSPVERDLKVAWDNSQLFFERIWL